MSPSIAIIGANGQVGCEVTLLLARLGVKVVPICRAPLSSVFLRGWGLECRHGDFSSLESARRLLSGCDTVLDLSLPRGYPNRLWQTLRTHISNSFHGSEPDTQHIYASSIMAFGMGKSGDRMKRHVFARTIYGAGKRYAERQVEGRAAATRKKAYILRLGEVNGELQNCTRTRSRDLAELRPTLIAVPAGKSYSVLTYSVAEAILSIAKGGQKPGLYTMASDPGLTWANLARYYMSRIGHEIAISVDEASRPSRRQLVSQAAAAFAERFRNEISSYVVRPFSNLESFLRFERSQRAARSQVSLMNRNLYRPFTTLYPGEVPGHRLRGLTSDLEIIKGELAKLRQDLTNRQILRPIGMVS